MSYPEGIDISHWQNMTPPLGNLAFVFVKATEGTTVDARWAVHSANVNASDAVLGAYHFGRSAVSVASQISAFLHTIGGVNLVALDLEKAGDGTRMSDDQARTFIRGVQASGRKCGLYHSDANYPALGQDWNWVAKWSSTPPGRPWAFWQYASGSEDPSHLDRDKFAGTEAQLLAFAHVGLPDSSTENAMQFEPTGTAIGVATLTKDSWVILTDGTRDPIEEGTTRGVFSKVTLADGRPAYLVAWRGGAAFLVADDRATYKDLSTIAGTIEYNAGVDRAVELARTARKS